MKTFVKCKRIISRVLFFIVICLNLQIAFSNGVIIPTNSSQADFLKVYNLVLNRSNADYRFTSTTIDTNLFPSYGEFSVYWIKTGQDKGSFVLPETKPADYPSVSSTDFATYNWQNQGHYSIQYKPYSKRIAIFRSDVLRNEKTISWEAIYFKNVFDSYIDQNAYYFLNEASLDAAGIDGNTQLIIIPSFSLNNGDNKFFIDSVFARCPNIIPRFNSFLANGGTIYAEGNAVYFIEKLGYLAQSAVNFLDVSNPDSLNRHIIRFSGSTNPLSFTEGAVGDTLFGNPVPRVNIGTGEVIADINGFGPVVFSLKGNQAGGGRIICNTGLPTIGGVNKIKTRQLQWAFNAILYAFVKDIDVTRSIYNDLPNGISAGRNAVSYDRVDTFEVRVTVRNLSNTIVNGIQINEGIRDFFKFVDVTTPGMDYTINGQSLVFNNVCIPAHTEKIITYRLRTPDADDKIHEKVDNYISWRSYIYASVNTTIYTNDEGKSVFWKWRNYVDIMFSARLVADADLNWKNILGTYYQPFKVFMIMENKERTSAEQTKYVQYIPKDVPFYWTDNSIDVPILKTPGGKYVDILRGSNDDKHPEFDMNNNGHPDSWLDTATIYPKGYTLTEDEVYWLNPWEHLRSGDTTFYEDINHDGIRAKDTDGDGIVDVDASGDKIRVWKVTWNINHVPGYDYYDPFCSYEIWIDPPDLVAMAGGVGYASKKCEPVSGMYYPYTSDISKAKLSDTTYSHWMERDLSGKVIWKQLIYQKIHNYEGFTFIDTLKENYRLKPTDHCAGTVPQPHQEYIAVLSLGGEEIDMTHPTPNKSLYSNLTYKTIFNEDRTTPIRTTYTYWAPLPNPMQFEYLSNNYTITDPQTGDTMRFLPEWGKANLTYDIDASTEYSYYWIRGAGHDVDYNDPSLADEGVDKLGDGVFGYMVYDIPKGMGGYKIDLPRKADGSFDINAILEVNGAPYQKWLDNKNTKNDVEIKEDPFQWHVYIPQLLIPPSLDDDNNDGIDDWIDDRGDRFASSTGFLHDAFMLDDGDRWLNYPETPFKDDIYGMVDSGWYHGTDGTYGDDFWEKLGKVHFKIHAIYEGKGKEGPIDISKGGWLVVEEIFGGSPWVIFSHVLSGYASGVDYKLSTQAVPSMVRFGLDTAYIKHIIEDVNEPHYFNTDFDPYYVSYGYGESTVTTYVGGKDPCSLVLPAIQMPAILDPGYNHKKVTLIPQADTTNHDLKGYPKNVEGTFLEVRLEVMNGTDDNWINTKIDPILGTELGYTKVEMSYVAYPRPLVPAQVDPATSKVIRGGDDIGAFRAGWRFNQPEGEVLIKMGNSLPLLEPTRRAYFVYLLKLDESLAKGIYTVNFKMDGDRIHYTGENKGKNRYEIPTAFFSITKKNGSGNVLEYQKLIVGTGNLGNLVVNTTPYFNGLQNVKVATYDINQNNFDTLSKSLPATFDISVGKEIINLSQYVQFPTVDETKLYLLEQGEVYSYNGGDVVPLTRGQELNYTYDTDNNNNKFLMQILSPSGPQKITSNAVFVVPIGPKVKLYKELYSMNGVRVQKNKEFKWDNNEKKDIEIMIEAANMGNDMDQNTILEINPGPYFMPLADKLPSNCIIKDNVIEANIDAMIPGETKQLFVHFTESPDACKDLYDQTTLIPSIQISYKGSIKSGNQEAPFYSYPDKAELNFPAGDFKVDAITSSSVNDVTYGSGTTLIASFRNNMIKQKDLWVKMFAIINHSDTILVGQKLVAKLDSNGTAQVAMNYVIPENTKSLEVFAQIDPDNEICEFCKNNNTKSVAIPLQGPNWIQNVSNNPNPFIQNTQFHYTLARDVNDLSIEIYSLRGNLIDKIPNCPKTFGTHTVPPWIPKNVDKGTYIYKIIGINLKGETEKYYGKLIKN